MLFRSGQLSDRVGRELVWSIGCFGFALCYAALLLLGDNPIRPLLYLMVLAQGMLGYGLTSVIGAIPAEIFEGKHYGAIFGTLMLAAISGGALAPWLTGLLHDWTGSYNVPFEVAIAVSLLSAVTIWRAAPGKVRAVAGQLHRAAAPG